MTVFEPQITHYYNQQDIQQILNLAIARQVKDEELSREQLVEIATEIGISTESLLAAEQEWRLQQKKQQKRKNFNIYRHSQLKKRFGKYLIVNSFLVGLNLISVGTLSWSLYIILFWGMWLGLSAWNTYQLQGEEYEQAFQKWYRKQQLTEVAHSVYIRINNWIKSAS
ncbi:MAG TPA: hypothetical protein DCE56_40835 [Cyanobacteria bacterium UBA8553]|nr:hypothetical protein [Cyanobacteria bacterium UBA8553]